MHFTFFVPGAPVVKGRPRFVKATGRTYTPKETLQEEDRIASLYTGPKFTGPVALEVTYYKDGQVIGIYERPEPETKFRGDLDNYLKLTGDALQGRAFENDRQVHRVQATLLGGLFDGDPESRWVPNLGSEADLG